MARIARPAMRAAYSLFLLSALLASPASSELVQVDIVGTVFFEGCPYSGTCWKYPLMWGVSGGEPMALRVIYDDGIPISEDWSQADHYFVFYEHAIPLQSPLGMEVSFGPYAVRVGSSGAAASYYWIDVFDVIEPYPNFPDISEAIGINIEVPPGGVILQRAPRASTASSCTASITACEISTAKTSWLTRRFQRGFRNSNGKTFC